MQKTLDKGRRHELDYRTLIQDLVHFLERIHNIWMSAVVLLLFSRGKNRSCFVKKVVLKQLAPILN
jgi:hypothetical protein